MRLEGMEKRKPGQLSGGQQQRVALARALVNRPAALLLDEPLGALDLKLRKEMQLELKHIQTQTGTTFVYVTHDQEEALTMSDRIAVMEDGLVEQVAAPRELYERPATPFVAGFIGVSNVVHMRAGPPRGRRWPSWTSARASASSRPRRPAGASELRSRCGRRRSSSHERRGARGSRVSATVADVVYLGLDDAVHRRPARPASA